MTYPVAVLKSKRIVGIGSLNAELIEDGVAPLEVLPLREALERAWDSDAHFVCYLPFRADLAELEDGVFRLRKEVLGELRAAGGDVKLPFLALDFDNPDHAEWTEQSLGQFTARVEQAARSGTVPAWSYAYATRHGARFIYVLAQPLVAEDAEAATRGLVGTWHQAGFELDEVWDWTRCYRLPLVTREGTGPSWNEPHQWFDDRLDAPPCDPSTLSRASIPSQRPVAPGAASSVAIADIGKQPTPEQAVELLETRLGGRILKTEFYKRAKYLLKGRECFTAIFENAKIAEQGERDRRLLRLVGEASALLHGEPGYTPAHLYALFLPAVQDLDPDAGTPDWTAKLWYDVGYCWRRQEAAASAKQEKAVQHVQVQNDLLARMAEGMARWCKAPELSDPNSDVAKLFVIRHLIVTTGKCYYLLGLDGWYDSTPIVKESHLPARLRESGLSTIIPLEEQDGKTKKPVPVQKILTNHMTFVKGVDGSLHADRCYIESMDSEDSRLVLSLFKLRTDLEPEWSDDIRRWMELLVGEDRIYELERWISWALDFREGPICALSIAGPPACGKKMLAMGLAECISTEKVATGMDLVNRFRPGLLETCFMVVDEGLPSSMGGGLDIADSFRRLVSGDPQVVDRKFLDPIFVRNPMRILFTANNMDVVAALARHRNLSQDDQAALAQRILHFDAKREAADWLRAQGGVRHTRGWIRGDSGEASRYVLAKHFLWLYANRHNFPRDTRLLVEGTRDQAFLEDMRVNSGSAPAVIEALVRMIESRESANVNGLAIDGCCVYASAAGVVDYARSRSFPDRSQLNHRQAASVFRGLRRDSGSGEPQPRCMKTVSGSTVRARWWQLDPVVLLREALRNGLPNTRLFDIVKQLDTQDARELVQAAEMVRRT